MTTGIAQRPPVLALDVEGRGSSPSRPQVLVVLERPKPAPWSIRQVAWFATRLGSDLLIASVVAYDRGLDELDLINLRMAKADLREVTTRLVEHGVRARGEVCLARRGDQALSVSDLAEHLDADLVIVLTRRGSWFGVFPGSLLAHHLMRLRRRPVLVIADHEPARSWSSLLLGLVRVHAPENMTGPKPRDAGATR